MSIWKEMTGIPASLVIIILAAVSSYNLWLTAPLLFLVCWLDEVKR